MRTRSSASGRRAVLAVFLGLAALGAGEPKGPDPLSGMRLLPPVLLQGEAGWTLEERMRFHKVEGVSVAVIKDFRVAWEAAAGLADREAKQPATTDTLATARRVLEVLPRDTKIEPGLREQIRRNAETRIKELSK